MESESGSVELAERGMQTRSRSEAGRAGQPSAWRSLETAARGCRGRGSTRGRWRSWPCEWLASTPRIPAWLPGSVLSPATRALRRRCRPRRGRRDWRAVRRCDCLGSHLGRPRWSQARWGPTAAAEAAKATRAIELSSGHRDVRRRWGLAPGSSWVCWPSMRWGSTWPASARPPSGLRRSQSLADLAGGAEGLVLGLRSQPADGAVP